MSDFSTSTLSAGTIPAEGIPWRRAVPAGFALLLVGLVIGLLLGHLSGPSLASAPNPAPRGSGLVNVASDEQSNPLSAAATTDLRRGSQDTNPTLESSGPLNTADPLQKTGPIDGLFASAALPLLPGEVAGPTDRWAGLGERVASVLKAGTPSAQTLEQLAAEVGGSPSAGGPTVPTGAPPTPLPPTVYDPVSRASPN